MTHLLFWTDISITSFWSRHVDERGLSHRAGAPWVTGIVLDRGQPGDQRHV